MTGNYVACISFHSNFIRQFILVKRRVKSPITGRNRNWGDGDELISVILKRRVNPAGSPRRPGSIAWTLAVWTLNPSLTAVGDGWRRPAGRVTLFALPERQAGLYDH
ncbi:MULTISPECIES: hypothetical protein [unclassified Burkholderia]|uniref:hypothetical protein n=1 Tax=unclassified Burkholderia TaxID=2613784 RepID=UPI00214FEEAA|nr:MULTISPECIES: hypothetical protein [unclassified Burkholderia]MCR4466881.1 hypothetical protein [Burkholderia sp. SCN-KJ]